MEELDQKYLNSVVAINVDMHYKSGPLALIGTGFLITESVAGNNFNVFLITNRHVIDNLVKCVRKLKSVIIRLSSKKTNICPKNPKKSVEYLIPLYDNKTNKRRRQLWVGHPKKDIDISVIRLNADIFRCQGWRVRDFPCLNCVPRISIEQPAERGLMTIKQMKKEKIGNRTTVHTIGYPAIKDLGLPYLTPSARATHTSGSIANIDIESMLEKRETSFEINISVAPGSSGSPVIEERYVVCDAEKGGIIKGNIIGIVSKGISYGGHTPNGSSLNEWTSNLTRVFPTDYILEAIEKCKERGTFATIERCA